MWDIIKTGSASVFSFVSGGLTGYFLGKSEPKIAAVPAGLSALVQKVGLYVFGVDEVGLGNSTALMTGVGMIFSQVWNLEKDDFIESFKELKSKSMLAAGSFFTYVSLNAGLREDPYFARMFRTSECALSSYQFLKCANNHKKAGEDAKALKLYIASAAFAILGYLEYNQINGGKTENTFSGFTPTDEEEPDGNWVRTYDDEVADMYRQAAGRKDRIFRSRNTDFPSLDISNRPLVNVTQTTPFNSTNNSQNTTCPI